MKVKISGVEYSVSFPAVAFLTLAIICDKKGTVLICFLSSIFHEIGHILSMRIKGVKLKSIRFNLGDVAINADSTSLSYNDEVFITVSGVALNLFISLLSIILWYFVKAELFCNLFLINLLIAAFNLLPVRFLDGGQLILQLLKKRFSPRSCDRFVDLLTVIFIVPIGILGLIFIFNSSYNFSLLFAALYLICTLVSKEFRNVS